MLVRAHITLKPDLLDPQGEAIRHALLMLGFSSVRAVRQNKRIDIELDESDRTKARAAAEAMCRTLLANEVIETFSIELPA